MEESMCQYVSDKIWGLLEPLLPGQRGHWGGIAKDNRQFIDGVLWILQTGSAWRDLPPEYGNWKNVHRRFCRWRDKGVWENILEILIEQPGFEWFIANPDYISSKEGRTGHHKSARTAKRSKSKYAWPWMRLICRSDSLSQRIPVLLRRQLSAKMKSSLPK